jgi:hypothetical protein
MYEADVNDLDTLSISYLNALEYCPRRFLRKSRVGGGRGNKAHEASPARPSWEQGSAIADGLSLGPHLRTLFQSDLVAQSL